jgi:predicted acyl esterase
VYVVTVEHNVAATMRDGTVLRADVYRPSAAVAHRLAGDPAGIGVIFRPSLEA